MAPPPRLPPKKDVALALLEQSTVYVHLDPRSDSVRVPAWFKKQPQLVLQIGLRMAIPIPDLDVSDEGISCTLSFNRSPHACSIPWSAVFALVGDNGRGMVWPDDVPKEVAAQAAQQQVKPEKPKLKAVPSASDEPVAAASKAPKKKRERKAKAEPTKKAAPKNVPKLKARPAAAPEPAKQPPTALPAPAALARKPTDATIAGARASDGGDAGDKRKRELPPYLRVIK